MICSDPGRDLRCCFNGQWQNVYGYWRLAAESKTGIVERDDFETLSQWIRAFDGYYE